jgi:hypothetical protein
MAVEMADSLSNEYQSTRKPNDWWAESSNKKTWVLLARSEYVCYQ